MNIFQWLDQLKTYIFTAKTTKELVFRMTTVLSFMALAASSVGLIGIEILIWQKREEIIDYFLRQDLDNLEQAVNRVRDTLKLERELDGASAIAVYIYDGSLARLIFKEPADTEIYETLSKETEFLKQYPRDIFLSNMAGECLIRDAISFSSSEESVNEFYNNYFIVTAPVTKDGEVTGFVAVYFEKDPTEETQKSDIRNLMCSNGRIYRITNSIVENGF